MQDEVDEEKVNLQQMAQVVLDEVEHDELVLLMQVQQEQQIHEEVVVEVVGQVQVEMVALEL